MQRKTQNSISLAICLASGLMVSLAPGGALADNDIGCGIGTILWEGRSGIIAKSLAATTNNATGSQTLGVTSGTLECQQGGVITASARIPVYASANLDRLAADMAAGEGEALRGLAELYGVDTDDRDEFLAMTQRQFAVLFPADTTSADQMIATLEALMAGNKRLARYIS